MRPKTGRIIPPTAVTHRLLMADMATNPAATHGGKGLLQSWQRWQPFPFEAIH
jgi:hypothetical protein